MSITYIHTEPILEVLADLKTRGWGRSGEWE